MRQLTAESFGKMFGDGSYELVFNIDDQDNRYDRYPYLSSTHVIYDAMLVAPDAKAIFLRNEKASVVYEDVQRIEIESESEIGVVLVFVCKSYNMDEMKFRFWARKKAD